jgi:hypothetical protein
VKRCSDRMCRWRCGACWQGWGPRRSIALRRAGGAAGLDHQVGRVLGQVDRAQVAPGR